MSTLRISFSGPLLDTPGRRVLHCGSNRYLSDEVADSSKFLYKPSNGAPCADDLFLSVLSAHEGRMTLVLETVTIKWKVTMIVDF
jgi:hypothetical protein